LTDVVDDLTGSEEEKDPSDKTTSEATPEPQPIVYHVYLAETADVQKEGVASQLNRVATVTAMGKKEARWLAIDQNEELKKRIDGGEILHLLPLNARTAVTVPTKEEVVERKKRS